MLLTSGVSIVDLVPNLSTQLAFFEHITAMQE